jgi:hypothetical protein
MALDFSAEGELLAVSGRGGSIDVLEVGLEALSERACSLANRNLTEVEWGRNMGLQPYRATCSGLTTSGGADSG